MAATTVRIPNFLGTGVDLIPLPRTPGFRSVDWQLLTRTPSNLSPYTGTEQIIAWPGAETWYATVTMPPLNRFDAAKWVATLMAMRGRQHAFQISNQLYALAMPPDSSSTAPPFTSYAPLNPMASEGAAPAVLGTNNYVGTTSLFVKGFPPNTFQALSQGDCFQIGYRYYMAVADMNADVNGNGQVILAPSLREAHADGTAIDINYPACLMRLDSSSVKWSTDYDGATHISFGCVEVR